MILPTIEEAPDRRTKAVQGITDMLTTYNEKQQKIRESKKLADLIGIPKDKRDQFAQLPSEWQKTYATMVQNEKKQLGQTREKIAKGTGKFLKDYHPSLEADLDAKSAIEELAQGFGAQGLSETDSLKAAVQKYNETKPQAEEEGSSFLSNLFPNAKKMTAKSGAKDIARPFTEFGEQPLGKLLKEKPSAALGSVGLGAAAPFEEVGRYQSKAAMDFIKSLGFTYPEGAERGPLATEQLREQLQAGLSPEAKGAASKLELLGGIVPIERVIAGLTKIGKSAGFLKNAEKIAAREGISASEAAQKIVKEAESAGIDLAKAAAGDKQEAGKLFNLSNRVSAKAPQTATELRVARAEPKAKMFPKEERIATRESQLKAFPKYEAEIAQDAAERAARAEAKIPKTVKGMDARRIRVHTAEKNLPVAEKGYRNALARTRALEDEVVKLKGLEKEKVQGLIEAAKSEMKDAEFFLKQTMQNISGGEARVGLEEMRKAAQKKMLDISEKIAAGEEIKLAKMDYNPEMVKEAQRLGKKKAIPSVKKDDFYQQVHKEYGDQYRKQLENVEKQLKEAPKTMSQAEKIRHLQKEKDVLKKLIDQTEAERAIHQHKLSLRETAERQRAKERLGKLQPKQGEAKVQRVAQEKIREAVKNPMGKEAEEVVSSIGAKKEDLKSAVDEFKEKIQSIGKQAKDKAKEPQIIREIDKFVKELKNKNWYNAFAKTPVGQELLLTALGIAIEEVAGKKVPYSSLATGLLGSRRGAAGIRTALLFGYKEIKGHYIKESYKDAVRKRNDKEVLRIRKSHPKLARDAQKELAA